MGELVGRFKHAYEQHGHKLLKVYCGLPLPRDVHSTKAVKWRAQKLRVWDRPWDKARQQLDDFGEELLPPRLPSGTTETRAIDA